MPTRAIDSEHTEKGPYQFSAYLKHKNLYFPKTKIYKIGRFALAKKKHCYMPLFGGFDPDAPAVGRGLRK